MDCYSTGKMTLSRLELEQPFYMANCKIAHSRVAGRGVFAMQDFKEGDLIEEAPVILVNSGNEALHDYVFQWNDEAEAFCAGFGSMYNHSTSNTNVNYYNDEERGCIVFTAVRDIKCGEELFISYGPTWFKNRDIEEIDNVSQKRVFEPKYLVEIIFALIAFFTIFFLH